MNFKFKKLKPIAIVMIFLSLAACQTVQERNQRLVDLRKKQLSSLSEWRGQECRVQSQLTEPARARYKRLFEMQGEQPKSEYEYKWEAREARCEFLPVDKSEISKSMAELLRGVFCIMLQVHFVNSPFDGLDVERMQIHDEPMAVRIGRDELGLRLTKDKFELETAAGSRGQFYVTYQDLSGDWLPSKIIHISNKSTIQLSDFEFTSDKKFGRRALTSLVIDIGDASSEPSKFSDVQVGECRAL